MDVRLQEILEKEYDLLMESVLRLLSEYGVLFESEKAHTLLLERGNKELKNGRIGLTERFVEETLDAIPKEGFILFGRDMEKTVEIKADSMSFRPATGMPFIYDYDKQERRQATLEDARELVILTDALDNYDMVNSIVSPSDAPGKKGNIRRFINAHEYSIKPSDITVATAKEVNAIGRIASLIRGGEKELIEKPLTIADISMITPLRCTLDETEAFLECAKLGIPVEILTSPSMGISSPITLAGSVAVSLAEMIAAVGLLYAVRPGLGVVNTARISPVNMRTTAYNYGAPELSLGSILTAAFSAKINVPCNLYGFGTAAKIPGIQSGFEKMLGGAVMAMGKAHMVTGAGSLDNSLVTCKEQLIIDHEMARFLKRIRKPIEISKEAIGIDEFLQGMEGMESMIAEEHTLKYLKRGELMDASLEQWGSLDQWEKDGKPDLLDEAHKRVTEILNDHRPPELENDLKRSMYTIAEEY